MTENDVLVYLSDVRVSYQKLIKLNDPIPLHLKRERNEILKRIETFNTESSMRNKRIEIPNKGFVEMRLKNTGVCFLYKRHDVMSLSSYTYTLNDLEQVFYGDEVDVYDKESFSAFCDDFRNKGVVDHFSEFVEQFINEFEKSFEKIQFTIDRANEFIRDYEQLKEM